MIRNNSNKTAFSRMLIVAVAASVWISAQPVKASLNAYEGFAYQSGLRLNGLSGGSGWSGAWGNLTGALTNNSIILSTGYGYSDGFGNVLQVSGNSLYLSGNNNLGTPDPVINDGGLGTAGGPSPNRVLSFGYGTNGVSSQVWISFLAQVLGPSTVPFADPGSPNGTVYYGRAQGFQLFRAGTERMLTGRSSQNGEGTGNLGLPNDTWALNVRGAAQFTTNFSTTSVSLTSSPPVLVLLRIDTDGLTNANDRAYMWLNPTDLTNPTNGAPLANISQADFAGATADLDFDRIRLFAGGSNAVVGWGTISIDEIRIGTGDPRDVLPIVPEPAVACLLGLAGLGLVLRFRRK
jgi:hypothetical protein